MTESTQSTWTIKRLLEWTTEYFQKVEADSPRLEAEVLLAEALDCARIMLYTRFDEVPDEVAVARFRAWVKRRAAGEPVAYLVGHREFYSLKFQVNEDVLIPRPETEHVVIEALEAAKASDASPIRVIDVGTGSGCIAVALAKHLDDCLIAATDVSGPALEVAHTNAVKHGVDGKIRFFDGDLFEALPPGSKPVHLIVSNPPYIGTEEQGTVDDSVADYEPKLALYSGPKGVDLIQRLVTESVDRLLPGGYLIFEASPINMDQCRQIVDSVSGLELIKVANDLAGLERVLVARRK